MAIKNILVAFNGTESAIAALKFARFLAQSHHAHVTAMLAHSEHEVVNSRAAWVPVKAQQIIQQANAKILAGIEKRFIELRDKSEVQDKLTFVHSAGKVDTVLSEAARHFDLLIAGARSDSDDSHISLFPDRISLMSGRPVFIVPRGGTNLENNTNPSAVLWDGSRASARALSDGLGLFEQLGRVTLLTFKDHDFARPVSEMVTHLTRHGIEVTHTELATRGGESKAVIQFCQKSKPSMLVMGAYEHSKFKEDFLGGLTAKVLKKVTIPVLISH